jgi:heme/copper-type cytochrome/quinol oxidase subunit 2
MQGPVKTWRCWTGCAVVIVALVGLSRSEAQDQRRLIEILADRDSRYKMTGMSHPVIAMKAGERVLLRITARRAHGANRDGSVHGFTLTRVSDGAKVLGWDLLLMPGTQDFPLEAPQQAGEYRVVCTVICSQDHEGMHMKVTVTE